MLMMVAIWSFLVFDYVWLLTQGGPAGASEVLGTFLYKEAFNRFDQRNNSVSDLSLREQHCGKEWIPGCNHFHGRTKWNEMRVNIHVIL